MMSFIPLCPFNIASFSFLQASQRSLPSCLYRSSQSCSHFPTKNYSRSSITAIPSPRKRPYPTLATSSAIRRRPSTSSRHSIRHAKTPREPRRPPPPPPLGRQLRRQLLNLTRVFQSRNEDQRRRSLRSTRQRRDESRILPGQQAQLIIRKPVT